MVIWTLLLYLGIIMENKNHKESLGLLYIKRGADGKIIALSHAEQSGFEEVDENLPEVITYLHKLQNDEAIDLLRADLDFIRVIEDVIDVLMKKNIITITDFHPAVIEKLLRRQTIRKSLSGSIGMDLNEDNDTL